MRPLRRLRNMHLALTLLAHGGCETFTAPPFCPETHRTPDAPYLADRWCDACIARVGLQGDLTGRLTFTRSRPLGADPDDSLNI